MFLCNHVVESSLFVMLNMRLDILGHIQASSLAKKGLHEMEAIIAYLGMMECKLQVCKHGLLTALDMLAALLFMYSSELNKCTFLVTFLEMLPEVNISRNVCFFHYILWNVCFIQNFWNVQLLLQKYITL